MKQTIGFAASILLAVSGLLGQAAPYAPGAAGVSGKWSGISGGPDYMVFKQDGTNLNGSVGTNEGEQLFQFENGKLDGDRLTFKAAASQFELRVNGDEIKGERQNGDETVKVFLSRVETPGNRVRSHTGVAVPPEFEVASVKRAHPPAGVTPDRVLAFVGSDPGDASQKGLPELSAHSYECRHLAG
jgi:hypothetical protein